VTQEPVVVLGAGLAGVCTALELGRRGRRVTLVEQASDCLGRASLRNEGKIHLGLVYANDPSGRTSELMLQAALRFDRIVERLVGRPVDWESLRSSPFRYAVLAGSLRTLTELTDAYAALQRRYDEITRTDPCTYLGTRPPELWRSLPDQSARRWLAPGVSQDVLATAELALDLDRLCRLLRAAVRAAGEVECRWRHRVEDVERTGSGYRLRGCTLDGEAWSARAAVVVNCLWDDRMRLDAQLGFAPRRRWVHRLKYRLLGRLPAALADLSSFTFVLGPFGDVVTWPSGRVYLSWYPACVRGWCSELAPPEGWQDACNGKADPGAAREVATGALCALARIVPGLGATAVDTVDAGIITAWGDTDIDDPKSELHQRHEVGPWARDGWISVDTGKLTTAPLFAQQAADLAMEAAG
jgi:2-polyprenyl-6-methoxyphenol hydroxylase-like FAD-dependent oxidoreductase